MLPDVAGVMLAHAPDNSRDPGDVVAELDAQTGRHTFDIKWDGVRCLAFIDKGAVRLVSRDNNSITNQYPEVVKALAETYANQSLILDGEMLVMDPAVGSFTFNAIQKRNAQSNPRTIAQLSLSSPATYMVFDLLADNGADLRNVMLRGRLMLLDRIADGFPAPFVVKSHWSDDGAAMWDFVLAHNLEGLIAKKNSAFYRSGRSSAFMKIKPTKRLTAIVYDWEHGKAGGQRSDTLGAVFIGLVRSDGLGLHELGKVGTGFKMAELWPLVERIEDFKKGLGDAVLIEVQYQEVLESGKLRFPRFLGERHDILYTECTMDQLERS